MPNFCPNCGTDEPGELISCCRCGEQMFPTTVNRESISSQEGRCFICGSFFGTRVLQKGKILELVAYPTKWNIQICSLCYPHIKEGDSLLTTIWDVLYERIHDSIIREKSCLHCKKAFLTSLTAQKFCSTTCHNKFHKRKNHEQKTSILL